MSTVVYAKINVYFTAFFSVFVHIIFFGAPAFCGSLFYFIQNMKYYTFLNFAVTSSSRLLNILGNVVKITAAVISPAAKSAIPSDI